MLAESDSESGAPSPSKNSSSSIIKPSSSNAFNASGGGGGGVKSRIASCKTYEEIRLEEIQAESAAFYSYGDYENAETAAGKAKKLSSIRSQRVAAAHGVYGKPEEKRDVMDFQVLSLDEIRKRRKAKQEELKLEEVTKVEEEDQEYLKNAVRTLDGLRDVVRSEEPPPVDSTTLITPKRKRNFAPPAQDKREEEEEAEASAKRLKTTGARAPPPVRLKRPGRLVITGPEDNAKAAEDEEERKKAAAAAAAAEVRLEGRPKGGEDVASKQTGVEVRVCDSSTDDNASDESLTDNTKKPLGSPDCLEELKTPTECDSAAVMNNLETAEDILKDIDALLS